MAKSFNIFFNSRSLELNISANLLFQLIGFVLIDEITWVSYDLFDDSNLVMHAVLEPIVSIDIEKTIN